VVYQAMDQVQKQTRRGVRQKMRKHIFAICGAIVDEGGAGCTQDAFFCEGDCQCWLHCWCAGVKQERPPRSSASSSFTGQAKKWSVVVSKGKENGNGRKGKGKGETEGKGNNANADVP